jgi:hypothetical protein
MLYKYDHPNTAKKAKQIPAVQNNISYRSDKIKLRLLACIKDIIDWLLILFA